MEMTSTEKQYYDQVLSICMKNGGRITFTDRQDLAVHRVGLGIASARAIAIEAEAKSAALHTIHEQERVAAEKKAEEARRRQQEEEERRRKEEERRAAEQKKKEEEEERRRKEEEERRRQEEERRAAEQKKKEEEEERRSKEEEERMLNAVMKAMVKEREEKRLAAERERKAQEEREARKREEQRQAAEREKRAREEREAKEREEKKRRRRKAFLAAIVSFFVGILPMIPAGIETMQIYQTDLIPACVVGGCALAIGVMYLCFWRKIPPRYSWPYCIYGGLMLAICIWPRVKDFVQLPRWCSMLQLPEWCSTLQAPLFACYLSGSAAAILLAVLLAQNAYWPLFQQICLFLIGICISETFCTGHWIIGAGMVVDVGFALNDSTEMDRGGRMIEFWGRTTRWFGWIAVTVCMFICAGLCFLDDFIAPCFAWLGAVVLFFLRVLTLI